METAISINSISNKIKSKITKEGTKMNSEAIMNYQQTITINSEESESQFNLDLPLKRRHSAVERYKILKNTHPRGAEEILQRWKHQYKQTSTINPDVSESQYKFDSPLKYRHSALEEYKILKRTDPRGAEELLQRWRHRVTRDKLWRIL